MYDSSPIHLLKAFWLLPSFGHYEESSCKYPCTGLCVHTHFQPLWVNAMERYCQIMFRVLETALPLSRVAAPARVSSSSE